MPEPRAPLLLLHGALGSAAQLAPIAAALGGAAVFEFPGHGATPLGTCAFGVDGFVAALAAQVGAQRPHVFGYSMGGYVALALEARVPGTFASITTLGTKFEWTPATAAREVARLDADRISAKVPRFAALLAERHAGCGGWEAVLRNTAQLLTAIGASPLLDATTLGQLRLPVHLAVGALDDTVDAAETVRVAALIPGAHTSTLDGVPHPIEQVPLAVLRALLVST
ncbi:MAG: alpha/beta hydrolase [Gemmatimonadaceae bacterium]|nr:alpha/beta hydrolase [Gemmatimonadaceae bacterium]